MYTTKYVPEKIITRINLCFFVPVGAGTGHGALIKNALMPANGRAADIGRIAAHHNREHITKSGHYCSSNCHKHMTEYTINLHYLCYMCWRAVVCMRFYGWGKNKHTIVGCVVRQLVVAYDDDDAGNMMVITTTADKNNLHKI